MLDGIIIPRNYGTEIKMIESLYYEKQLNIMGLKVIVRS